MNQINLGWGHGRCNMGCHQCYNRSSQNSVQYELSVLREIADKICPQISAVNYGTGEFHYNQSTRPLLHYIGTNYPHVKQAITTNGFAELFWEDLAGGWLHDLDVSIDYPGEEEHNENRQHEKAWKMAMRAIDICKAVGVEVSIVSCIMGGRKHKDDDIRRLLQLAREKGVYWRANWLRPVGRGKDIEQGQLTGKRVWEIMKIISQNSQIVAMSDPLFDAVLETNSNSYPGCACGEFSCRIQMNLQVTPCVFLGGEEWAGGSIQEINLEQAFKSEAFNRLRSRKPSFCLDCKLWEKCRGGCASRAVTYRGSLNEPDEFCPIVNGLDVEEIRQTIKINNCEKVSDLVHNNYLCTLIVDPS